MGNHVQAYAPNGALRLNLWDSLTSKLDGYPITSGPLLHWERKPEHDYFPFPFPSENGRAVHSVRMLIAIWKIHVAPWKKKVVEK